MRPGLLIKAMREAAVATVVLSVSLMLVELILTTVLPTLLEDLSGVLMQVPFLQTIIGALLGTDIGDVIGPETISAFACPSARRTLTLPKSRVPMMSGHAGAAASRAGVRERSALWLFCD